MVFIGDSEGVELVEDPADPLVDCRDAGEVVLHVSLVLRPGKVVTGQFSGVDGGSIVRVDLVVIRIPGESLCLVEFGGCDQFEIAVIEMAGDRHGLQGARRASIRSSRRGASAVPGRRRRHTAGSGGGSDPIGDAAPCAGRAMRRGVRLRSGLAVNLRSASIALVGDDVGGIPLDSNPTLRA